MEELINSPLDSFRSFLAQKKSDLKESKTQNPVVSFCSKINGTVNLSNKINYLVKYYERSFYFEKPQDGFLILAVDDILSISENGEKRFAATDKKVKELRSNFINNWESIQLKFKPLFVGGMKFNIEHADEEWKDFNDSTWFIPEFMFVIINSESYLFFNFINNSAASEKNLVEKFRSKLENFLKFPESQNISTVKINKQTGNTPKDKKKWKSLVNSCLENIYNNKVNKIVVSRRLELILSGELNLDFAIEHFGAKYPECYLFIFHKGKSSFFGATPERLINSIDGKIEIEALAGSAPRGSSELEDKDYERKLLNNQKDIKEHDFVVNHIKDTISNLVEDLTEEKKHTIKKLKNIQHISTLISARMNSHQTLFSIVKELFPTPAVCGIPKEVSLNLIKKLESYYRGLYSGIVGWFNFEDEGELVVAIRSALTQGCKLIAYAGSGIVEQSDPDLEYEETELKFKPILSLFNENQ